MNGLMLAALAALCWAIEAILARRGGEGLSPILGSAVGCMAAGAVFLAYMAVTRSFRTAFFSSTTLYFVLAGIVALAVGRVLYFLAIDQTGVSLSVTISATYPLIASVLSFLIFKEPITLRAIVGIAMITLGGMLLLV